MRIRKTQPRAVARGQASSAQPRLERGEIELDSSSRGVKEKPDEAEGTTSGMRKERGDEGSGEREVRSETYGRASGSRSSFTWLDKLRHAKGFTAAEPYVNLDDFVSSLARKDSHCSEEGETQVESLAGEGSLSRSAVNIDLNKTLKLARGDSVASQSSSKPAGTVVLYRNPSLPVASCIDSSMSEPPYPLEKRNVDPRLQSGASVPRTGSIRTAAERGKSIVEDVGEGVPGTVAVPTFHAGEEDEDSEKNSALGFYVKSRRRKQEEPHLRLKSPDSLGEASSGSWMQKSSDGDDTSSEVDTHLHKGHLHFSGKNFTAGTSSAKPKHQESTAARVRGQHSHNSLSPNDAIIEQGRASPPTPNPSNAGPAHTKLRVTQSDNNKSPDSRSMQRRSSRNRRVPSITGREGERFAKTAAMVDQFACLAPDHPANQPEDSLIFSVYTVFHQAGKAGLTAREALSSLLRQGLAGLEESGVESRRQVTKILRSSPYFMELEEGKFALCTAMIDAEQEVENEDVEEETSYLIAARARAEDAKQARLKGTFQRLASHTRIKSNESEDSVEPSEEDQSSPSFASEDSMKLRLRGGRKKKMKKRIVKKVSEQETDDHDRPHCGRPKRLKYMKQENIEELGNQCNRTDGKGWTCPLLAKPGYQLCDHHLDKLRCKPGSRSKKKKAAAVAAENSVKRAQTVRRKTRTSRSALPIDETEILGSADTAGHEINTLQIARDR